jgi:hypothetical protein
MSKSLQIHLLCAPFDLAGKFGGVFIKTQKSQQSWL